MIILLIDKICNCFKIVINKRINIQTYKIQRKLPGKEITHINQKKSGVSELISYKCDFKTKILHNVKETVYLKI